jgi:hypothetical protein
MDGFEVLGGSGKKFIGIGKRSNAWETMLMLQLL